VINAKKDIVLITGGSSGLGRTIAVILATKGYTVVILDVNPIDIKLANLHYYQCDVSDFNQIRKTGSMVKQQIGIVTILINNAAVTSKETILELTEQSIRRTLEVNLLSHFWTIKTFLPDMLELRRGYIVTVSSALGYIGPARLSCYSASKGGLITMHDSITHETKGSGIKTLLVTMGQMNSDMFRGVQTPSEFLAPVVSTVDGATAIVDALENGYGGEITLPTYAKLLPWTRVVPGAIIEFVRAVFRMDEAMDTFVGR
jgi:NAD(P)-dependent dehydrogenase (short-subunit alcohol dehydrogenase family)